MYAFPSSVPGVPLIIADSAIFPNVLTFMLGFVGFVSYTLIVSVTFSFCVVVFPLTVTTGFFWSITSPVDTLLTVTFPTASSDLANAKYVPSSIALRSSVVVQLFPLPLLSAVHPFAVGAGAEGAVVPSVPVPRSIIYLTVSSPAVASVAATVITSYAETSR